EHGAMTIPGANGESSPSPCNLYEVAAGPLAADSLSHQPASDAGEIREASETDLPHHREEQKAFEPRGEPKTSDERREVTDEGRARGDAPPPAPVPAPVVREPLPAPALPVQVLPRPASDLIPGGMPLTRANEDAFSIQVNIGRVEVRAVQPKPEEPRKRPSQIARPSLESYLQRRRGSGHE